MVECKLTKAACGNCRWAVKAKAPEQSTPIGVGVWTEPWQGFSADNGGGQHYDALGAHYCEHEARPRGLVLTNYSCRDFKWSPVIDDELAIGGRAALAEPTK